MPKIANLQRKGQFIINALTNYDATIHSMDKFFFFISNFDLDNTLKKYRDYLVSHGVCPICYNDLNVPDKMIEIPHCHVCKWDTDSLNYTK